MGTKLTVEKMKVFALLLVATVVHCDWEVKRGQNFLTCGNDDRIDQYSADLATCQADAEAAGATHIFWQSADWRSGGDWCHLYASCDENNLRKPSNNGWTYYLDADNGWTIKSFRTCSTDYRVVNENNVNWQIARQRQRHWERLIFIGKQHGKDLSNPRPFAMSTQNVMETASEHLQKMELICNFFRSLILLCFNPLKCNSYLPK